MRINLTENMDFFYFLAPFSTGSGDDYHEARTVRTTWPCQHMTVSDIRHTNTQHDRRRDFRRRGLWCAQPVFPVWFFRGLFSESGQQYSTVYTGEKKGTFGMKGGDHPQARQTTERVAICTRVASTTCTTQNRSESNLIN